MRIEHLIADTFGTHIGKYSKRLKVTQNGETLAEAPLLHLKAVWVTSNGISISSDALEVCCEMGIPVHFTTKRGNAYASIYASGLGGTILTRRQQLMAYYDHRGVQFALKLAEAKIYNQSVTLKYLAKTRKDTALHDELHLCAAEVLDSIALLDKIDAEIATVDSCRNQIMAAEGQAAKRYWQAAGYVLPEHYEWPGRSGRGATDPLNSLLNYGYGVLYGLVEQAIILAGLDPYAGFLHADRPGKPSLVLDLIEEFRQTVVDRTVFGLANVNFVVEQHDDGMLKKDTRQKVAERILQKMDTHMRYNGKRYPLQFIIQSQARHLASFLRDECDTYSGFKATW
ncbi:MAG: CRISPR-associated endonuclease Cas1 [Chloroflexi bacterium]|nr:CRISPR-associated endonuclease Cas1 [Chloroflexota bacterium]